MTYKAHCYTCRRVVLSVNEGGGSCPFCQQVIGPWSEVEIDNGTKPQGISIIDPVTSARLEQKDEK